MKEEIKIAVRIFIYGNAFFASLFFWFHAPQILLCVRH